MPDDIKESFPTISSFSDLTFEGNTKRRKLSHESENVENSECKNVNDVDREVVKDVEMEVCTNAVTDSEDCNNADTAEIRESGNVNAEEDGKVVPDSVMDSEQPTKFTANSEGNAVNSTLNSVEINTEGTVNATSDSVGNSEETMKVSKVVEKKKTSSDCVSSSEDPKIENDVCKLTKTEEISNKKDTIEEDLANGCLEKKSVSTKDSCVVSDKQSKGESPNAPDSTVEAEDIEMKEIHVKEPVNKPELSEVEEPVGETKEENKSEINVNSSCEVKESPGKEQSEACVEATEEQTLTMTEGSKTTEKTIKENEIEVKKTDKPELLITSTEPDGSKTKVESKEVTLGQTEDSIKEIKNESLGNHSGENCLKDVENEPVGEKKLDESTIVETSNGVSDVEMKEENAVPDDKKEDSLKENCIKDVENKPVVDQLEECSKVETSNGVTDVEMNEEHLVPDKKECSVKENSENTVTDSTLEKAEDDKRVKKADEIDETSKLKPVDVNISADNKMVVESSKDCKETNSKILNNDDGINSSSVDVCSEKVENKISVIEEDKHETENKTDKKEAINDDKLVDGKVEVPVDETENNKADNNKDSDEAKDEVNTDDLSNKDKTTDELKETEIKTDINNSTTNGTHETIKNGTIEDNIPEATSIKEKVVEKGKDTTTAEQNGVETTGEV